MKREPSLRERELLAAIEEALEKANPCYVVIWRIWEDSGRKLRAPAMRELLIEAKHKWTPSERTLREYLREIDELIVVVTVSFRAS